MKIGLLLYVYFFSVLFFVAESRAPKPEAKKELPKPTPNSLGLSVRAEIILTKAPFSPTRCDQIVAFQGQLIPDFDDYTRRQDVYFTITAYHVNAFAANSPETLLQSILLSETKKHPLHIRGARGCVEVDGGKKGHPLAICGKNHKEAENLYEVLRYFADCRGIEDTKNKKAEREAELIRKALRACGLPKIIDPKKLKLMLEKMKKDAKKKADPIRNAEGFFHPGFKGVPGTN